jgi:hypothetical protein
MIDSEVGDWRRIREQALKRDNYTVRDVSVGVDIRY